MPPEATSDENLMRRFQETADESAFNELVLRYHRPALAIARGRLAGRETLAEDAVQEAFLRVVRHRDRFDCRRPFAAWFYTILRNLCADFHRKATRREQQLRELEHEAARAADERRDPGRTAAALAALEPDERDIIVGRFVHGLTLADLAAGLGISEEAAKKRAQRALQRLRQAWTEEP